MTKIFYLYDRFFESNRNFTTEHVKIVKIPVFKQSLKTGGKEYKDNLNS